MVVHFGGCGVVSRGFSKIFVAGCDQITPHLLAEHGKYTGGFKKSHNDRQKKKGKMNVIMLEIM